MFDAVAVVDWSARARPATGADSIWIATVDGGGACHLANPPTRAAAVEAIARLAQAGRRTLVSVDFSIGFPRGTAGALGLTGTPWAATWRLLADEVDDGSRNDNNRFDVAAGLNRRIGSPPGPFWGCPPAQSSDALTSTKPPCGSGWPPQWRHVEARLRADGLRPFDAWQLLGAGSVGSQSLLGIGALQRLRDDLGVRLCVWPFDTGATAPLDDPRTELVVAEVWPSRWRVDVPPGVIKDAAQVEATARRLWANDQTGALRSWFAPELDAAERRAAVDEEGWVLGVR